MRLVVSILLVISTFSSMSVIAEEEGRVEIAQYPNLENTTGQTESYSSNAFERAIDSVSIGNRLGESNSHDQSCKEECRAQCTKKYDECSTKHSSGCGADLADCINDTCGGN